MRNVWLMLVLSGCCFVDARAQELEGACRISTHNMQWSGVAVAQDQVLTIAHHGLPVGSAVHVELPMGTHGSDVRVSLKGKIRKINRRADLCLIAITSQNQFRIREYKVGSSGTLRKGQKPRVKIRGFILGQAMVSDVVFVTDENKVEMIPVATFEGQAVQGMSGSPVVLDGQLVGIQFGGSDRHIDAVTIEQIGRFLSEDYATGGPQ